MIDTFSLQVPVAVFSFALFIYLSVSDTPSAEVVPPWMCRIQCRPTDCNVKNSSDCGEEEVYVSSDSWRWCPCCTANCCGACVRVVGTYLIKRYIATFAGVRADAICYEWLSESHSGCLAYRIAIGMTGCYLCVLSQIGLFGCHGNETIFRVSVSRWQHTLVMVRASFVSDVRVLFRFCGYRVSVQLRVDCMAARQMTGT
jgi:hypothetical protein